MQTLTYAATVTNRKKLESGLDALGHGKTRLLVGGGIIVVRAHKSIDPKGVQAVVEANSRPVPKPKPAPAAVPAAASSSAPTPEPAATPAGRASKKKP
jgi:hypothetical protein